MQSIFDSHFHIIEPDYPLVANQGYLPPPYTIKEYLKDQKKYGFTGGIIVSGSFQSNNYTFLTTALKELGVSYGGVINCNFELSDHDFDLLNNMGVKGIRVNLRRSEYLDYDRVFEQCTRLHNLFQWHTEFYVGTDDLADIQKKIIELPSSSIDHLGLSKDNNQVILNLVEQGVKIKATGFGRLDFDPVSFMQTIHNISPTALMFGSDLPSTRANREFRQTDIELISNNFSLSDQELIFRRNAKKFYRMIN